MRSTSLRASAHASSRVSRVITCARMPKESVLPCLAARARTSSIRAATLSGGSVHVRYVSTCAAATSRAASLAPPKNTAGAGDGGRATVAPVTSRYSPTKSYGVPDHAPRTICKNSAARAYRSSLPR
ncbi:Uncharacterised protein [Mycobacteroides abscessus subsp. abscessus]|nr:Uncharacterised protein [Mycobacteroides abscessus subsp. abscessus]